MDSLVLRRAATAFAAAALAVPVAAVPGAWAAAPPSPGRAVAAQAPGIEVAQPMGRDYVAGLRRLRGPAFERAFMAGMISHHYAAVTMARLELARGTRAQLRTMASRIATGQAREIARMTAWLRTWYRLSPARTRALVPPALRRLQARMESDMRLTVRRLAATPAGPRFDRAFLTAMIPHHGLAVAEARTVPGHATHPQLVTMARQISAGQSAEIRQMRAWLRAWYRVRG